jgi:copper chaperone CopZ
MDKIINVSDMATTKEIYRVVGMTCSGCERTVQKVVQNIEGVTSSKADSKLSNLTVEFDPSKVDLEKIKTAVNKVGYKFMGQEG